MVAKTKTTKASKKGAAEEKASNETLAAGDQEVTVCRRRGDRRDTVAGKSVDDAVEPLDDAADETADGPPERRKVQRRRQIDPTTCERDYTDDEIEFMHALDAYKRSSGRMFPTCSEILEVVRGLGYQRVEPDEFEALDSSGAEASLAEAGESLDSSESISG